MSNVSANTRRLAERNTAQAKSTFNKAGAETRRAEQSALTAFNGARHCYLKMIDMAHDNTVASFDLARELASVQTPLEFAEIWNARTREAYDTFSEQTKELSDLMQKLATSTTQPLTNGLTTPFRAA
jgi:hypothetical protein